ncbi:hypothetical protein MRX96_033823 [Rhipicephalus microplus]
MTKFCMSLLELEDKTNYTFTMAETIQTTCKVKCSYRKIAAYRDSTDVSYNTDTISRSGDALDHMSCGTLKVCIKSVCVDQPRETKLQERDQQQVAPLLK